eukprot:5912263-Pyramimonas_sp.AAC.1
MPLRRSPCQHCFFFAIQTSREIPHARPNCPGCRPTSACPRANARAPSWPSKLIHFKSRQTLTSTARSFDG